MNWRFDNGALVGDQAFIRGARRITVNFDNDFNTCSVNVIYGRENGAASIIVKANNGGGDVEEANNVIASTSCSVRQGNIFDNPQ